MYCNRKICRSMKKEPIVNISYERLMDLTDDFSESNYLGDVQFGKFYRGKVSDLGEVIVKIWEIPTKYVYYRGDNYLRLTDEIILLQHENLMHHPAMVKLYGFCADGKHLAAVYELKALDSVYNLIPKENGFNWLQRIKAALGLASLIKFLHAGNSHYKPFKIRNLDVAHIILDENYNPKLCDFGMISGGIFPDRTIYFNHHICGCYGYIDLCAALSGEWTDKQDVFAFGVIVLGLISKRVYTPEEAEDNAPFVHKWSQEEFEANAEDKSPNKSKFCLVHPSLAADPDFCTADGRKLVDLVIDCISLEDYERPNMRQVMRSLRRLKAVKKHADFLEVSKFLHPLKNGGSASCDDENGC